MKVLTFVIPAYNSEKFLDKVLTSMLHPQVLERLEIIVVNDGSTDATAEIARGYCEKFPQTVRLISQENKGHGGALNTGLAAAGGKYVKVIDADDWVETANLPAFLQLLEACESDVVLTHHDTVDIGTGQVKKWMSYPEAFCRAYTLAQVMENWRSFDRSLTFHGITYKTEFYRAFGKPLCEQVFYEDHEYATFPCCHAATVQAFDLFVYHYRIGDVAQSVSQTNQVKRIGHIQRVLGKMSALYRKLPESAGKEYAAMKLHGLLMSFLTTALLAHPDKRAGRRLASEQMALCKQEAPRVYELARKKYRVFCLLNRLHISKAQWDVLVDSALYRRLQNHHSFQ